MKFGQPNLVRIRSYVHAATVADVLSCRAPGTTNLPNISTATMHIVCPYDPAGIPTMRSIAHPRKVPMIFAIGVKV